MLFQDTHYIITTYMKLLQNTGKRLVDKRYLNFFLHRSAKQMYITSLLYYLTWWAFWGEHGISIKPFLASFEKGATAQQKKVPEISMTTSKHLHSHSKLITLSHSFNIMVLVEHRFMPLNPNSKTQKGQWICMVVSVSTW